MKHIFVVNKNAKNGKNTTIVEKIHNSCKLLGLDFKICITETTNDLKNIVAMYKTENNIIYAVGGDGTINLVLNELVGGNSSLGIIPVGSGNDFYRKLNEYNKELIDVNVMKVNDKYGINIFSLGIDAEICANAEKMKNLKINSNYIYICSILYTFFKYKNKVIGINDYFEKMVLLAICNGSYYGGGFKMASSADITDDKVLVYLTDNMKKIEMLKLLYQIVRGTHDNNKHISVYEGDKTIYLETYPEIVGQLDGELMMGNNFVIEPSASNIKVVNNRELIREIKRTT